MEQRENGRPASLARSLTLINDRNLLAHPCQSFEERRGELKWVKKTVITYILLSEPSKEREREAEEERSCIALFTRRIR